MSSQVVRLPGPRPLRHCLLWRSLLLTLLQSLLVSIIVFPTFSAVNAEPVSIRYLKAEVWVAVYVAAVEVAGVADEQHVLVVTKSTLVAGVVVVLGVHHELFLFDWHSLSLADVCFLGGTRELEDGSEGPPAARTNGRRFAPFGDACEAEFVEAFEAAPDRIVLVEADGTHVLVCAALLVLDVGSLLELLLHRLRGHIRLCRRLLARLLDRLRQQNPPLLISQGIILLLLSHRFHHLLSELFGGGRRHNLAGRVDAGLVK